MDKSWVNEAWEQIEKKISWTSHEIGAKYLHASVNGKYTLENPRWWTSGFWPGLLLKVYEINHDNRFLKIAEECEAGMDGLLNDYYSLDHDLGFMWSLTSVARYKLNGSPDSKLRALKAANFLSARFNPNGNFIRAWNDWKDVSNTGWSIIDTMMNLPLLYWASKETNDPRFKGVAIKHADTVLKYFIREDGAVHHIVEFDAESGRHVSYHGGQGYAPFSAWARGTAWAIYGLTLTYHYTNEERFLLAAIKVAQFFIANLPDDYVPVWDFRIPEGVSPARDSSAGAIAACGLLLLAEKMDPVQGKVFQSTAEKMLKSLYENYGSWNNPNEQGLILQGTSHFPNGKYIGNPLIYGDYFFVEGITKLMGSSIMFW